MGLGAAPPPREVSNVPCPAGLGQTPDLSPSTKGLPSLGISLLLSHGPKFFLDELLLSGVFTHHLFRVWM